MPFVNVKLVKEQVNEELKKSIITDLTDLIVNEMGREKSLTNIVIDEIPSSSWAVGGEVISPESQGVSFINIKVSKGTTSPQEMSKMNRLTKELMSKHLKNHIECNYFIIDELNPEGWGFGDKTMMDRAREA